MNDLNIQSTIERTLRLTPVLCMKVRGILGGTRPLGGPNNTKSGFLTHRTTHSAKIFGHEAPQNGAEGAVFENFRDFSENCFLKLQ